MKWNFLLIVFIVLLSLPSILSYGQVSEFETWASQKREEYDKWKKMREQIVANLPKNDAMDAVSNFIDQGFNSPNRPSNTPNQGSHSQTSTTAVAQVVKSNMKVWVVIVGVAKYKDKNNNLNFTIDDAYKMYAFYKSPEGGSLPDRQISLLINEDATRKNVLKALNDIYIQAGKEDAIIFYFAGHGSKNAFITYEYGDISSDRSGVLMHDELRKVFDNSKARYKYIIADACHSGSIAQQPVTQNTGSRSVFYEAFDSSKEGFVMILSSMSEEVSWETSGLRQGVFSFYLLRGLKGESDSNNDRIVTVTELYDFVQKNVVKFTDGDQNPILFGNYDNNLPIAIVRE